MQNRWFDWLHKVLVSTVHNNGNNNNNNNNNNNTICKVSWSDGTVASFKYWFHQHCLSWNILHYCSVCSVCTGLPFVLKFPKFEPFPWMSWYEADLSWKSRDLAKLENIHPYFHTLFTTPFLFAYYEHRSCEPWGCHCLQLNKCRFCKFLTLHFCTLLLYLLDRLIGKCPNKCP